VLLPPSPHRSILGFCHKGIDKKLPDHRRVGVFPEREEVLILGANVRGVALKSMGEGEDEDEDEGEDQTG